MTWQLCVCYLYLLPIIFIYFGVLASMVVLFLLYLLTGTGFVLVLSLFILILSYRLQVNQSVGCKDISMGKALATHT